MNLDPKLGLAAAALLLAGIGGAASAHPHPEGEGEGKKVERFVIIHDGKAGEHHAGADRIRRFEMHGLPGRLADCDGGEKIVDEAGGDGDDKTKVIICRKGEFAAGDAKHLEDALARIQREDHFTDEQKARIETALRSAIDRARSAR
ncbi:MAG TPA: hypothetical protein VF619_11525 [Allosphingosinicella sp.]|jgi:hypothetical protein